MLFHSGIPRSSIHPLSSASQSNTSLNYKERKISKAFKLRSHFMKQLMLLSVTIEAEQAKLSTLHEELVAHSQRQQREAERDAKKGKDKDTASSKKFENGKQKQESKVVNNTIHESDETNDGADKGLKTFLAMKSKIGEQERKISRLIKDVDLVRLRQKEVFKIIWEDRGMDWGKLDED